MLNAAEALVIDYGVNGMTLEAVASRAKVSKGGLLYHFASKEVLVQAMVSRIAVMIEHYFTAELTNQPLGRNRHAHTLMRIMMDGHLFPRLKQVAAPLLAAMASDPKLLDPMRRFLNKVRQGMCDDGLSAERTWLILAALDGIKFWRIFQLFEPSDSDLAKVRCLLEQIIDSECAS